jgi:hypothetical protein
MLVINIFQLDSHRRGASDNSDIPTFSGSHKAFWQRRITTLQGVSATGFTDIEKTT